MKMDMSIYHIKMGMMFLEPMPESLVQRSEDTYFLSYLEFH